MAKIRYSHRNLYGDALKSRWEHHSEKMDGVADYATYQPKIAEGDALMPGFRTAITNSRLRGTDRTRIRQEYDKNIISLIDDIAFGIEREANRMEPEAGKTFIFNAGFEIVERSTKVAASPAKTVDFLEVPANFDVTDVKKKSGFVEVSCDVQKNTLTHLIQELDAEGRWNNTSFAETFPITLSGFSVGAHTFRIMGISNDTLTSGYSDVVTVWVS
jgi:hypothetical protein